MVVTDTLEHSSCNSSQVMEIVSFHQEKDAKQEFTLPHKRKNTKSNAMRSVSHSTKFQKTVKKKLFQLEKTIISQQADPNNSIFNSETSEENGKDSFFKFYYEKRQERSGQKSSRRQ